MSFLPRNLPWLSLDKVAFPIAPVTHLSHSIDRTPLTSLSASRRQSHAEVTSVHYSHPYHFFVNSLSLFSETRIHFEDSEAFAYKKGKEITLSCLGGYGFIQFNKFIHFTG